MECSGPYFVSLALAGLACVSRFGKAQRFREVHPTLHYGRGSFGYSEIYGSCSNAVDGAYAVINLEGHHSFTIEEGGQLVMRHSQIERYCLAAKAELLRGRMPARGNVQP
jgi:hypothetical protein